MFDNVSRLAERAAVNLSRRRFLTQMGRIGMGALALATFVGEAAAGHHEQVICVLNAGCCGGTFPYQAQKMVNGNLVPIYCCKDSGCTQCVICAPSTCCHGAGNCASGVNCHSDKFCVTPC
jgi:hypothetical protein